MRRRSRRATAGSRRPDEPDVRARRAATGAPAPLQRKAGSCACGGGCPRCAAGPAFQRERFRREHPSAAPRGSHRAKNIFGDPIMVVRGFHIDSSHCGCRDDIKDEIRWASHMMTVYRQCRREVGGGSAREIADCKDRKNAEQGIETQSIESVSMSGEVEEAELEGPCGEIIEHGVNEVHVPTHLQATDKLKESGERVPSGRDFASNEILAYRRERRYLRTVQRALRRLC